MNKTAIEIFTDGNDTLATKLKTLVHRIVDRANEEVGNMDNPNDLLATMKIAEVAGKITGIVQDKQVINMQINNISGFTFIEVENKPIIQEIDYKEEDEPIDL